MVLHIIEREIRQALRSSDPHVVCISGNWGVGKTYIWNKFLKEAKASDGIAMLSYSYVSLFGVNSLDELKTTIFFNSLASKDIGIKPSIKTMHSNIGGLLNRGGKSLAQYLSILSIGKISANMVGPLGFLSISDTIVCIDDIERRGDKLSVRDVLGLVSTLREQKNCTVIMILNNDAMAVDRDKADFDNHSEKVIEVNLQFAPTAEECAAIALDTNSETAKLLARHCVMLGISNIRVRNDGTEAIEAVRYEILMDILWSGDRAKNQPIKPTRLQHEFISILQPGKTERIDIATDVAAHVKTLEIPRGKESFWTACTVSFSAKIVGSTYFASAIHEDNKNMNTTICSFGVTWDAKPGMRKEPVNFGVYPAPGN